MFKLGLISSFFSVNVFFNSEFEIPLCEIKLDFNDFFVLFSFIFKSTLLLSSKTC